MHETEIDDCAEMPDTENGHENESVCNDSNPVPLRRSSRSTKLPNYLQDYVRIVCADYFRELMNNG